MIQLKSRNSDQFELTDKLHSLSLEQQRIKLDEEIIESSGEYEANGVEVVYGEKAALIGWENLQTTYIFQLSQPTAFEKANFAPTNVLIIAADGQELTKQLFGELLEAYDPSIVIIGKGTKIENLASTYKFQEKDLLKVSTSSLPEGGREFYLLG